MSVDRGFTWMDDETVALIDIFSKEDVQQELNGSKRNIGVYERIARELSDVGFRRTAYQCREKIKRLRKEYQSAKYCFENNIAPKKPMKHFELVDKIFNQDPSAQNSCVDVNLLSSDQEDELHFSFNHDQESDASNSCTGNDSAVSQAILPGPSCSPLLERENSPVRLKLKPPLTPPSAHNDSNDTLLNGEQNYDCSDKDSPIDDSESPWVPNVVLVENDLESGDLDDASENDRTNNLNENERLEDFQNTDQTESSFKDESEPPQKRRKQESTHKWLKTILDSVTDNFLKYQESTESRFLEQITCLEQERMKRDESMHRLWMEFEERRRKEEQQHELKMISLLGQFVHQLNENGNHDSK